MNKLILLLSLCIFSSVSWSNCVGNCVNGYGTYTNANGDKYVGQWKANQRDGYGTYTWRNGNTYVGGWKVNQRTGQGTISWLDGDKYVGKFKDNQFSGQGAYTFASGNKYVGEFPFHEPIPSMGVGYLIDGRQLSFNANQTELRAANGQIINSNVQRYELGAIRRESVENTRRADELIVKRQPEKDRQLALQQRQNKKLIVGIQRQLIEYQYLNGTADGIAGKKTSVAIERFYQDAQIIKQSLDDYATITRDLDFNLMNAKDTCFKNSASQSPYSVCFSIQM